MHQRALANIVPDFDEAGNILPIVPPKPPAPPSAAELAKAQAQAEERARLKEMLRQQREAEEAAARAAAYAFDADQSHEAAATHDEGILSPKIDFATKFPPRSHAPRGNAPLDAPRRDTDQRANKSMREDAGPLTHPSPERASAPLSDEAQMAAWSAAHRKTPFHQALQRTRNAQARKQRAAAKRLKAAKRHARRRAG